MAIFNEREIRVGERARRREREREETEREERFEENRKGKSLKFYKDVQQKGKFRNTRFLNFFCNKFDALESPPTRLLYWSQAQHVYCIVLCPTCLFYFCIVRLCADYLSRLLHVTLTGVRLCIVYASRLLHVTLIWVWLCIVYVSRHLHVTLTGVRLCIIYSMWVGIYT